MRRCAFTGGSLDGAESDLPAGVTSVVTTGGNYYEIDDTGTFRFAGSGKRGAAMAGIIGRFRQDGRSGDQEAIEAAARPRSCSRCGGTYGSASAYTVHFESGEGSRCLPGDARGQLVSIDGVWCLPGSDAARN